MTTIYELRYANSEGYVSLLLCSEKQLVDDFVERVESYDHSYLNQPHDITEDMFDDYNDNHPLAPYKLDIFNMTGDSFFSEHLLEMNNETWASDLEVIERELLSEVSNVKTN